MTEWLVPVIYVWAALTIAMAYETPNLWRGLLALLWPIFIFLGLIEFVGNFWHGRHSR